MTDKQILETLKNIKEYCISHNCACCVFGVRGYPWGCDGYRCQIKEFLEYFRYRSPHSWVLEDIEKIMRMDEEADEYDEWMKEEQEND